MLMYESIMYCILNTIQRFDCFAFLTLPFVAEELRGTESQQALSNRQLSYKRQLILSTYLST